MKTCRLFLLFLGCFGLMNAIYSVVPESPLTEQTEVFTPHGTAIEACREIHTAEIKKSKNFKNILRLCTAGAICFAIGGLMTLSEEYNWPFKNQKEVRAYEKNAWTHGVTSFIWGSTVLRTVQRTYLDAVHSKGFSPIPAPHNLIRSYDKCSTGHKFKQYPGIILRENLQSGSFKIGIVLFSFAASLGLMDLAEWAFPALVKEGGERRIISID